MPRPQIVIENPILNMSFAEPARHFPFDDEGITDDVVEGRGPSSYFMPIPKAKKKGGQLLFDEWTGDRIEENRLINRSGSGWPGGGSWLAERHVQRRGCCSSTGRTRNRNAAVLLAGRGAGGGDLPDGGRQEAR
jgi:hypothetical protein